MIPEYVLNALQNTPALSYPELDDDYLYRKPRRRVPAYDFDESPIEESFDDGPDPLRLMKKARTGATVQAM